MEAPPDPALTTVTVFSFPPGARAWAFAQMGLARPLLLDVPGMRFCRMMGAGRGKGFTLKPDWSRYAMFAVWDSEAHADTFLERSAFMRRYLERAERAATARVRPVASHGAWDGDNPFAMHREGRPPPIDGPVAILTRATIRMRRLSAFWGMVPQMNQALDGVDGLVSSIGIGEMPFYRQATFSVWESLEAMKRFAYASPLHREIIQRTRQEGWYSEELFARFEILKIDAPFP